MGEEEGTEEEERWGRTEEEERWGRTEEEGTEEEEGWGRRMGTEEGGGGGDRGWGRTEDDDDDDKKAHELESLAQALNEDEGDIEMVVMICPLSAKRWTRRRGGR